MKRLLFSVCALFAIAALPPPALAQQLGGGESPDISIWRILLALLLSLLLGGLVIWFLYMRNVASDKARELPAWLTKFKVGRVTLRSRDIEILDMRKLNAQTDACLLNCRGTEYFLLLGSDGVTILSQKLADDADATEEIG